MSKAVFLDRDGVVNRKAPKGLYITRWEDMEFLPGVVEAIALLKQAGFRVIVVTNQRCVAKGLLTVAQLEHMHQKMCALFAARGAILDGVYYCPHEISPACECRKPAPGMLLQAARDQRVELADSWMIGDSEIDMLAGRRAGCRTAYLGPEADATASGADLCASSLLDATHRILKASDMRTSRHSVAES